MNLNNKKFLKYSLSKYNYTYCQNFKSIYECTKSFLKYVIFEFVFEIKKIKIHVYEIYCSKIPLGRNDLRIVFIDHNFFFTVYLQAAWTYLST